MNTTVASPTFNEGDYAWTMASAALVFMMIPGIALFYSGLRSQQTSLSLVWVTLMAVSIVFIQWFLFGYSLAFSPYSNSRFIGDFSYAAFRHTIEPDAFAGNPPHTPALVYGLFQSMFAAFTGALVAGVVAERGRLLPFLVFTFFWATFVYDFIAYWIWNENGWSNHQGGLDWAGGTPVHICSGGSALAYTIMLKYNRLLAEDRALFNDGITTWKNKLFLSREYRNAVREARGTTNNPGAATVPENETELRPHNMMNALLGTMLVWFGWFGFNAGSELQANSRAASTFMASNLAACSGGMAFCILEMAIQGERWSGFGFCTGAFAGLVAITPGAGYVPMWAGLVFGPAASFGCWLCMLPRSLEDRLEEPFVIPIVHGLGGVIGMLLTGFLADRDTISLDQSTNLGGGIDGNWKQLGYQILGGGAGLLWSFFVSLLILIIIQLLSIPFESLMLRANGREGYGPLKLDEIELGKDNEAYNFTSPQHAIPVDPRTTLSSRDGESIAPENTATLTSQPVSPSIVGRVDSAYAHGSHNGAPINGSAAGGRNRTWRFPGAMGRRESSAAATEMDDLGAPMTTGRHSDSD